MRIFLAIEFDVDTKLYLAQIQQKLRPFCVKGNFSRQENFHLTVRFIGETDRLYDICDAADEAAEVTKPFAIDFKPIGYFNKRGSYILWTGVKSSPELCKLHHAAEDGLLKYKVLQSREHEFHPHITLVREARLNSTFDEIAREIITPDYSVTARGLSVMESTHIEGKLTYVRRHFSPFRP